MIFLCEEACLTKVILFNLPSILKTVWFTKLKNIVSENAAAFQSIFSACFLSLQLCFCHDLHSIELRPAKDVLVAYSRLYWQELLSYRPRKEKAGRYNNVPDLLGEVDIGKYTGIQVMLLHSSLSSLQFP